MVKVIKNESTSIDKMLAPLFLRAPQMSKQEIAKEWKALHEKGCKHFIN
jgi:hypothetical protein